MLSLTVTDPVLKTELKLGEGPLWDERARSWYFLDITDKKLFRWNGDGDGDAAHSLKMWSMSEEVSVIRQRKDKEGTLVCASRSGFHLINEDDGSLDRIGHVFNEEEQKEYMFNDGAVDAKGRFYAGSKFSQDKPKGKDEPVGVLWRLDPDNSLHRISEGHTIPNGIGWSPDNKLMYFTDSQRGIIWQFDYDLETGEMSNKRVFVDVTPDGGEPDGLCVDVEGCIWSARFNGAKMVRYSPQGEQVAVIHFPKALNVTCAAFGGVDMDELLVTTAAVSMTPEDLEKDHPWDQSGHIYKIKVPVKGLPIYRYGG